MEIWKVAVHSLCVHLPVHLLFSFIAPFAIVLAAIPLCSAFQLINGDVRVSRFFIVGALIGEYLGYENVGWRYGFIERFCTWLPWNSYHYYGNTCSGSVCMRGLYRYAFPHDRNRTFGNRWNGEIKNLKSASFLKFDSGCNGTISSSFGTYRWLHTVLPTD